MNRRTFLGTSGLAGLGAIAGLQVLNSIAATPASARVYHSGSDVREIPLVLQDTPELQQVGGSYHLEIEDLDKSILVVRTGESDFDAVDLHCPHKGCEVSYATSPSGPAHFACPCHGSEFTVKGDVTKGPAKQSLGWYETVYKDGTVTVRIPTGAAPASAPTDSTKVPVDSTGKK